MPRTVYRVIEKVTQKQELMDCSSESEAFEVMGQLVEANPESQYTIEEVVVYDKEAFRYGRDPELH